MQSREHSRLKWGGGLKNEAIGPPRKRTQTERACMNTIGEHRGREKGGGGDNEKYLLIYGLLLEIKGPEVILKLKSLD